MRLELSVSTKKVCTWAIVTIFCYSLLLNIVGIPVTLLIGENSFDTMLVLGTTILIQILAIGKKGRRLRYSFRAFTLLCLAILLTKFLYPSNYAYMSADINKILMAFAGYVVIRTVYNEDNVLCALNYIGYISFIYAVCIVLVKVGVFNVPSANVSYMQFGYFVLPSAILLHNKYNYKGKKIDLAICVFSVITILVFGSRGAVVSFLLYLVLYYLFIEKSQLKKIVIILAGSIGVFLILYNSYVQSFLVNITSNVFHYDSRSLMLLIEGSSFDDSGRSIMSNAAISLIKNHWFLGMGAYADRANINFSSGDIASLGYGHYVHNIFLEMCLSFGIPFTLMLCILFIKKAYYILKIADDRGCRIFVLFTSLWIFELNFSGSFWTSRWFWGGIAIMIEMCIQIRKSLKGWDINDYCS